MDSVVRQIWDRGAQEIRIYFVLLITVLILYLFKKYIRIYWAVFQLNGPPSIPFIGNAYMLRRTDLLDIMSYSAYNDYGTIARFWLAILPCVILLEPHDLQNILSNSKHTSKICFYRLLSNFLGKGLITSEVETWKKHRRMLQPAFHLQVLQEFIGTFAESADRLANKILQHDGEDIDITKFINDAVYEILNETVLGMDVSAKVEENGKIDLDDLPFRKGQITLVERLLRPWLLFDWIYKMTNTGKQETKQSQDLASACRMMIEEKRRSRKENKEEEEPRKKHTSLLEFMLKISERNPECFGDEDIVNECCTFMLAGQDSVGTATAMTLFLLANHPEWQHKCVEELDNIFEGDESRSPTMQDLRAMRNLELCIKEALRLYPSVPLFARTLGEDVKVGKYVIPAGCGIIILPYSTHRLPHHFSDPHSFRPERFSPENSEKRHPYAYLPFSAGPRNCIGNKFAILEMKAMISAILRRCHLGSVEGKTEVRPKFRITVRASGGLWVKITHRVNPR